MNASPHALLDEPGRLRVALSPIRRRLLDRLRTPASATQVAAEMTLARQQVNYHLRALESAGFIELVEERQRRGCVERILAARARTFVVDPLVVSAPDVPADTRGARTGRSKAGTSSARVGPLVEPAVQDRFSANHLIDTAAAIVREVARMQTAAEREGTRLLTFTIDTEIRFPTPADLEHFTTAVAAFIAQQAATFERAAHADRTGHTTAGAGRPYRIVIGGHPSPATAAKVKTSGPRSTRSRRSAASSPSPRPKVARH